jgi:hypothetical protein
VNLIFLHGLPATGKYTVGCELAALTGYELFHNHIVVDEVLSQHAFGTPEFVALRDRLWREHFGQFPGPGRENIIFTFNPERTVPQDFIDWLFTGLPARGVNVLSIELSASEGEIERRLAGEQRQQFRKLTDLTRYRELRASGAFDSPLIPMTHLRIDTERFTAADAARQIVAEFAGGPFAQMAVVSQRSTV